MNFREHIKENHYMSLEGLARKMGVSHNMLRGIAVGTHRSKKIVDQLITDGYIKSADDLPRFKGSV